MGVCASSQYTKKGGKLSWPPPMAKIIYPDGRLQEFRQTIKASLVLSQNLDCFLCNSELMFVNSRLPHVPEDEELQPDQLYFLMPQSKSQKPLSLQELCSLAVKASTALSRLDKFYSSQKILKFSDQNGAGYSILLVLQDVAKFPLDSTLPESIPLGDQEPKNCRLNPRIFLTKSSRLQRKIMALGRH